MHFDLVLLSNNLGLQQQNAPICLGLSSVDTLVRPAADPVHCMFVLECYRDQRWPEAALHSPSGCYANVACSRVLRIHGRHDWSADPGSQLAFPDAITQMGIF